MTYVRTNDASTGGPAFESGADSVNGESRIAGGSVAAADRPDDSNHIGPVVVNQEDPKPSATLLDSTSAIDLQNYVSSGQSQKEEEQREAKYDNDTLLAAAYYMRAQLLVEAYRTGRHNSEFRDNWNKQGFLPGVSIGDGRSTGPIGVPSAEVMDAILNAADAAGVNASELLAMAFRESSFNPDAHARDSSALGLFQFIDGTFLEQVYKHGREAGIDSRYVEAVQRDSKGEYQVTGGLRQEVLNLRRNITISANLGALFAKDNLAAIESRFGEEAVTGRMYEPHFLGQGGAAGLLSALQTNPNGPAATILPKAASVGTNHSLFYKPDGTPYTVQELDQKLINVTASAAGRYDKMVAAARGQGSETAGPTKAAEFPAASPEFSSGGSLDPHVATYVIETGKLYFQGQVFTIGSGYGDKHNDPLSQNEKHGVTPTGVYLLGGYDPKHSVHMKNNSWITIPVLHMTAITPWNTPNRDAPSFLFHAANSPNDQSQGCPVVSPEDARTLFGLYHAGQLTTMNVVATEEDRFSPTNMASNSKERRNGNTVSSGRVQADNAAAQFMEGVKNDLNTGAAAALLAQKPQPSETLFGLKADMASTPNKITDTATKPRSLAALAFKPIKEPAAAL